MFTFDVIHRTISFPSYDVSYGNGCRPCRSGRHRRSSHLLLRQKRASDADVPRPGTAHDLVQRCSGYIFCRAKAASKDVPERVTDAYEQRTAELARQHAENTRIMLELHRAEHDC